MKSRVVAHIMFLQVFLLSTIWATMPTTSDASATVPVVVSAKGIRENLDIYEAHVEYTIKNWPKNIKTTDGDIRGNGGVILARMERIARGWTTVAGDTENPKAKLESDIGTTLRLKNENSDAHWLVSVVLGLEKYPDMINADLKRQVLERAVSEIWRGGGNLEKQPLSNHLTTWLGTVLLAAEQLGDQEKMNYCKKVFDYTFQRTRKYGEFEFNSSYADLTRLGLAALTHSDDPEIRAKAEFLLDFILLNAAHVNLPGYLYPGPESRDHGGALDDWKDREYGEYILFPETWLPAQNRWGVGIAASGYQLPDQILEIYLNKGTGGSFQWTRLGDIYDNSRHYGTAVMLDGEPTIPMHYYVLKDQAAAMGASHSYTRGWPANGHTNSIYTSRATGQKTVLIHIQPGDTPDYNNSTLPADKTQGSGEDDWVREFGGRARRVFLRNVMVQVWNPYGLTYEFTQAHIPKYERLDQVRVDDNRDDGWWFIGKQGDAYIAYAVFGETVIRKDKGSYWLVRANGKSGGIGEIAHADDYASFEDFKNDILSRDVKFDKTYPELGYQARDENGNLVTISVRYDQDILKGRTIGGRELTKEDLTHPIIESPWVHFPYGADKFTVSWPGCPTLEYDWKNVTIAEIPLGPGTSTPTPTSTNIPSPTSAPTSLPTNTPNPTATSTPLPTNTPTFALTNTPTPTPTATPTPTLTETPLPIYRPTPTSVSTPSPTPAPMDTPTPTATSTPLPTDTPTFVPTTTPTPTPTSTPTPTLTETPLPTFTPTATSTSLPTSTPTLTPTPIPPSMTPTATSTLSSMGRPTPTPEATAATTSAELSIDERLFTGATVAKDAIPIRAYARGICLGNKFHPALATVTQLWDTGMKERSMT